jgi:DNA repair exonuclease SbcCD nuclease subunit
LHGHKFVEFDYIDPKLRMSRRLADCVSVIFSLVERADKLGARHIIISGDLFHKMGIIEVETYNTIFFSIKAAAKDHEVHLMRGNHDTATKDGTQHSLLPFAEIRNVHVHDGPFTLKDRGESVDVVFLPYSDNEQETMARVKKYSGRDIAFMHHGFQGAHVGSTLEYVVKEPLDPKRVGRHFSFIFSGHYHKLQFVADNVMYIGSPLEHTRSDVTLEGKGFITIDTNKVDKPEFTPLRLPRFLTLKAGIVGNKVKGNYIDYQLGVGEDAAYVSDCLRDAGARGWNLHPYVEPKRKKSKSERRVHVKAGMAMERIVRVAAQKRCPPALNEKTLAKLMLEVLREAEAQR